MTTEDRRAIRYELRNSNMGTVQVSNIEKLIKQARVVTTEDALSILCEKYGEVKSGNLSDLSVEQLQDLAHDTYMANQYQNARIQELESKFNHSFDAETKAEEIVVVIKTMLEGYTKCFGTDEDPNPIVQKAVNNLSDLIVIQQGVVTTVKSSVNCLKQAFKMDSELAQGWHDNIAMACYDSIGPSGVEQSHSVRHEIANEAASRFMKRAFDVVTKKPNIESRPGPEHHEVTEDEKQLDEAVKEENYKTASISIAAIDQLEKKRHVWGFHKWLTDVDALSLGEIDQLHEYANKYLELSDSVLANPYLTDEYRKRLEAVLSIQGFVAWMYGNYPSEKKILENRCKEYLELTNFQEYVPEPEKDVWSFLKVLATNPNLSPAILDDLYEAAREYFMRVAGSKAATAIEEDYMKTHLNPAEALYGFVAWLTTRQGTIQLGSRHDCSRIANMLAEYCKTNNLEDPREDIYPDNLKVPGGQSIDVKLKANKLVREFNISVNGKFHKLSHPDNDVLSYDDICDMAGKDKDAEWLIMVSTQDGSKPVCLFPGAVIDAKDGMAFHVHNEQMNDDTIKGMGDDLATEGVEK